eukprot:Rhum_TRINITY_DN3706_c0_g1::Rhum_TRINITY_DN3706_c0_g1_i1::g.11804::m.11804/K09680/coaW; type II pantothenate kinase
MPLYLGVDVGGSLVKIACFGGDEEIPLQLHWKSVRHVSGKRVYMGHMPTTRVGMQKLVTTIEDIAHGDRVVIAVTGGGVHKHKDLINRLKHCAGVYMCQKTDEFRSLAYGVDFLCHRCLNATLFKLTDFLFHGDVGANRAKVTAVPLRLGRAAPLLLVNVGTGTSFVDLDGNRKHVRVGGSSLGGGTFLGLCRGLTHCRTFGEAMALASEGDSRNVDMVVGDIYGPDEPIEAHGLRRSTLASSFAKLADSRHHASATPKDRALSALVMITMNIAALAHLHARLHTRSTILFTGTFLQHNPMAMRTLAYAIHFWSAGTRTAIFVQNPSYLGSLGCLSSILEDEADADAKL